MASEFPTTHWTVVMQARGDSEESQEALNNLCTIYYAPVRAFIKETEQGLSPDLIDDLTQGFFDHLLHHSGIKGVKRGYGRFRSYLLGAVKHYLSDCRDKQNALKRGGGKKIVSLDSSVAEVFLTDDSIQYVDSFFDRQWAKAVVEHARQSLEAQYESYGQTEKYEILSQWLSFEHTPSEKETAGELGITVSSVRMVVYRFRKEFKDKILDELRKITDNDSDLQAEYKYLFSILTRVDMD